MGMTIHGEGKENLRMNIEQTVTTFEDALRIAIERFPREFAPSDPVDENFRWWYSECESQGVFTQDFIDDAARKMGAEYEIHKDGRGWCYAISTSLTVGAWLDARVYSVEVFPTKIEAAKEAFIAIVRKRVSYAEKRREEASRTQLGEEIEKV